MAEERLAVLWQRFKARLTTGNLPPRPAGLRAVPADFAALGPVLFRAQLASRLLDLTARKLQPEGRIFYTIGSAGHEGTAALAAPLKAGDISFLHYRDGAYLIARAFLAKMRGEPAPADILEGMALSFTAAAADPVSGGRHKVLGSAELLIPPQTSTIASHLPKAVGAAFSIPLARRLKPPRRVLSDNGIALVSFGDASANHSTAQSAFNAASWTRHRGLPMPIFFVCEDNGLGISVPTPHGWIEESFARRPHLHYIRAEGADLADSLAAGREAVALARRGQPAFLHMATVRLGGHAGSDIEGAYLPPEAIAAQETRDPLLHSARLLIETGTMTREEVLALAETLETEILAKMRTATTAAPLGSAEEVMASIAPQMKADEVRPADDKPAFTPSPTPASTPAERSPFTLARAINRTLDEALARLPELVLLGEDVGKKGGVYGVTRGLQARHGPARVMDTLLDEQTILGIAIGMAHNGFLPVPEIQFLAYLHNAEDQIRGEAATLSFFSNGRLANPMVVRIAGLGYQRGFGGHFHNDNSLAVLRDIPGLILACPSRADDAALMLREVLRLAREEGRVVVFLEPIALYNERDLLEPGDGGWTFPLPPEGARIGLSEIGIHDPAAIAASAASAAEEARERQAGGFDLALVSYGNGHRLCRQVQHDLEREGLRARVIDLRWLAPLPEAELIEAAGPCREVLIVDECRRSGNVAEALVTAFAERGSRLVHRLSAEDSFIATGPAYAATLPSRERIRETALGLLCRK